ncbi:MAG: T9SS type A sorting domain-containing protein [Hymenobacteraceae bacterium]|nr:T9SS type A sorting domain-containing protein [Hymenobacteraceae bacterium]MDX5396427.1 T9SS type A sorting domain-containing protein [Hymenobacteraceae bacterium]MDX5443107.1 T9SS type A sorting domain-containing protein [Hymenobacteraceae bacterium]MDX5512488.1 T9SS type A sorting domain-containing protein [Hymenobacteraceae bacterium]
MKPNYKLYLILVFLFYLSYHASAQAPNWAWAQSANVQVGSAYVTDLESDATGNTYTLGRSSGGIGFGNLPYLPELMYLVKHNPQGNPVWAIQANCYPSALAVDPAGNAYITGKFQDTLKLGGHVLVCRGKVDAFIAKVDSSGSVIWARQAGGTGNPHLPPSQLVMEDEGVSVGVDSAGNCYVGAMVVATDTSAAFFDTISFFPPYSTHYPREFHVLAKYNPAGDIQWVRFITADYLFIKSMTISNNNSCYITGGFLDTVNIGTNRLISKGQEDICFASYDLNGNLQWAQSLGGTGTELVSDIATDRQGNVLLTGSFQDTIQIGSVTLIKQPGSAWQRSTLFLAKFTDNGNPVWASQAQGTGRAGDSQLAIDDFGNSYLHSTFSGNVLIGQYQFTSSTEDVLVSKWDSLGNAVWAVAAQGGGLDFSGGIALAPSGTSCYVAGNFERDLNFGNIQLATSQMNFFLAKLDNIVTGLPTKLQSAGTMVYPNPATGAFHVALPDACRKNGKFLLYSGTGQLVKEVVFSDTIDFVVERGSLPSGLYIYRVESEGKIAGAGKIVLE